MPVVLSGLALRTQEFPVSAKGCLRLNAVTTTDAAVGVGRASLSTDILERVPVKVHLGVESHHSGAQVYDALANHRLLSPIAASLAQGGARMVCPLGSPKASRGGRRLPPTRLAKEATRTRTHSGVVPTARL